MMEADIEMQPSGIQSHSIRSPMILGKDSDSSQYSVDHIQSLTIVAKRDRGEKTLKKFAANNKRFGVFLTVTGGCWSRSRQQVVDNACFLINRGGILFFSIYWAAYCILEFQIPNLSSMQVYFALILLMIFVGGVVVLPAQTFNVLRLDQRAEVEDFMATDESLRVSVGYGVASLVFTAIGSGLLVWDLARDGPSEFAAMCGNICVVAALAFNMFFLLLDLKVSLLLLDQLHLLADRRLLTLDRFVEVREDIHRRVQASKLACDFVILPALASVIVIVLALVTASHLLQKSRTESGSDLEITAVQFVGLAVMEVKELLFVGVAFSYVARVNARADELTRKLSKGFWGQYQDTETEGSAPPVTEGASVSALVATGTSSVQLCDLHRISMHMSAVSDPISFTLAFKRVTWGNVALGTFGFAVTLLVGIIKNVATASVTS